MDRHKSDCGHRRGSRVLTGDPQQATCNVASCCDNVDKAVLVSPAERAAVELLAHHNDLAQHVNTDINLVASHVPIHATSAEKKRRTKEF